ncbi:MAG: protein kinase [Polyangiaceae bacterium]|nr:protein kinase [Polyangiaceae bacterium]MCE7889850.1 response regulator [Sorangiineae bacterium PRO1]MCL4753409.1 protein kinase [Myxococcales bacterium]
MSAPEQEPPRQIGKYEILRRLAYGGMAEVLLGRVSGADGFSREVVIKRVLPQHSENGAFIAMFRDEARITAQLYHGNIVQVIDFDEHEGQHFLVLEYVNGPSLGALLGALRQRNLRLTIAEAAYITSEVARALDYAHRKRGADGGPLMVVHRDVSPSNILISHEGEVKLVDFGIARARARLTPTAHGVGVVKGKLSYLAPEALDGRVEPRSDLFALGVVAYEMLTGRQLFTGTSEAEVIYKVMAAEIPAPSLVSPDVPPEVDQIVVRLLNREISGRPARGLEVVEALGAASMSASRPAMETLAATLSSLQRPASPESTAETTERRRVLVVDQSRTMRALVRTLIGSTYHVIEAASAEEAQTLADDQPPDAVVCQAHLPGQSGVRLCEAMRGRPGLARLPFVLLASDPSPELEREAAAAGVAKVLPKRLEGKLLLDALGEVLKG